MITISLPPSDAEEDDEEHDPLSVGPGGRCDDCGELVDDGMKCTDRCPDQICRQKLGSRLRSAVCALKLVVCTAAALMKSMGVRAKKKSKTAATVAADTVVLAASSSAYSAVDAQRNMQTRCVAALLLRLLLTVRLCRIQSICRPSKRSKLHKQPDTPAQPVLPVQPESAGSMECTQPSPAVSAAASTAQSSAAQSSAQQHQTPPTAPTAPTAQPINAGHAAFLELCAQRGGSFMSGHAERAAAEAKKAAEIAKQDQEACARLFEVTAD